MINGERLLNPAGSLRGLLGFVFLSGRSSQVLNPGTDIIGSNQRFTHQHGLGSGFQNLQDVLAFVDSTFTHDDFLGRNPWGQSPGNRKIGREGRQVPIVDADQGRVGNSFQDHIDFRFVVRFNQHVECQALGHRIEVFELNPIQGRTMSRTASAP